MRSITINDLRDSLHYKSHNKSLISICGIISCIKSFWEWLDLEGILEENPAKFLHYPKYTKNVRAGLGVVDIEVCREACNSNRERAIFEFLLARGCRIGEAKDLLYSDVFTGEFQVLGKGSKICYCYLDKSFTR